MAALHVRYRLTVMIIMSSLVVCFIIFLDSCSNGQERAQKKENRKLRRDLKINIHGANALYPLTQTWSESYMAGHPGTLINVFPTSSNKGKVDVMLGLADIGMYSDLPDEELLKQIDAFAVAMDAVIVTFNSGHPDAGILKQKGISQKSLERIFISGGLQYWEQIPEITSSKRIMAYTRSDLSGTASAFARFLGTNQEKLIGTGVYGDAGIIEAIRKETYSLGYNNHRYAFDNQTGSPYEGIAILPIDFDGNGMIDPDEDLFQDLATFEQALTNGLYPNPLARKLYFLIKADQDNLVVLDFIYWSLHEGQTFLAQAGYAPLSEEELAKQRMSFNEKYGEYLDH